MAIGTAALALYELFDVHIVATAFGICNIFARITTITSPYIAELKPDTIS